MSILVGKNGTDNKKKNVNKPTTKYGSTNKSSIYKHFAIQKAFSVFDATLISIQYHPQLYDNNSIILNIVLCSFTSKNSWYIYFISNTKYIECRV